MVSTFPEQQTAQTTSPAAPALTATLPVGMEQYANAETFASERYAAFDGNGTGTGTSVPVPGEQPAAAATAPDAAVPGEPEAAPEAQQQQQQPPATLDLPDDHPLMQRLRQLEEENRTVRERTQAWEQERLAEQQRQHQQQFQATQTQMLTALGQWMSAYRDATGAEIPLDVQQQFQSAIRYGLAFQQPDVQQRFNQVYELANTYAARDKAREIVHKHFGDTASGGTLRQAFDEIVKLPSEDIMEAKAQLLAERWRQQNAQRRIPAERIEGTAPAQAGAPNSIAYYEQKIYRNGGGTDALTPQEWDRYMELRQRSGFA